MPTRSKKSARRVVRPSRAALARTYAEDPFLEQHRQCVLAVYRRLVAAGSPSGRETVGRAFGICTSQLQRGGYLLPGTRTPSTKGRRRSLDLLRAPGAAAKAAAYETLVRRARGGRPPRRLTGRPTGVSRLNRLLAKVEARSARKAIDLDAIIRRVRSRPKSRSRARGAANASGATNALKVAVPLQRAALEVFTCDTSFGDCDPKRPSRGHCLMLAMVFQDLVGGEIRTGRVKGIPHYWNRVGRVEIDLTADQFGLRAPRRKRGALYGKSAVFPREPNQRLDPVGDNPTVNRMYTTFSRRLRDTLRMALPPRTLRRMGPG
jgi:hypothetical protein